MSEESDLEVTPLLSDPGALRDVDGGKTKVRGMPLVRDDHGNSAELNVQTAGLLALKPVYIKNGKYYYTLETVKTDELCNMARHSLDMIHAFI